MAKGTLQAAARTTKKSTTSLKGGKSAIIGGGAGASDKPAAAATSSNKKSKKSTAASSAASLDAAPAAPASDDVVLVVNGVEKRKLNVKDQRYMKHYKAIVKESLEGGEMRTFYAVLSIAMDGREPPLTRVRSYFNISNRSLCWNATHRVYSTLQGAR